MLTKTPTSTPVLPPPPPAAASAQIVAEILAPNALLGGHWRHHSLPYFAERRALVPAPKRVKAGLPARLALAAEDALCDLWGSLVERRDEAVMVTDAWAAWLN